MAERIRQLKLLGCSHHTASLSLREHIAFSADDIRHVMAPLHNLAGIDEAVIFSTCNRTEICYVGEADMDIVVDWLAGFHTMDKQQLKDYLYFHSGEEAMIHLAKVASGLDSMVLGEPQVFGQIKDSYKQAKQDGYMVGLLDSMLQQIFAIAKRVRTTTGLGKKPLSLASVAVRLAERQLGISGRKGLIIGAGHNAALIARYLERYDSVPLLIANRTHEKAVDLARSVGGEAIRLMDIAEHLNSVDMIFTSTSCPTYLITKNMVESTMSARSNRPLFIADLSVPRDVEPSVSDIDGVSFFILDDMQELVQENQQHRQQEAQQAMAIIEAEIKKTIAWMNRRQSTWRLDTMEPMIEGKDG